MKFEDIPTHIVHAVKISCGGNPDSDELNASIESMGAKQLFDEYCRHCGIAQSNLYNEAVMLHNLEMDARHES